jgi:SAM-dependent methyltransferase
VTEYILPRGNAQDVEHARLRLLEEKLDPLTSQQLDAIGVGEGWRCLDVGAGGGSVTRMLAERVGNSGSVLATDLDPRMIEPLAGERVEVRRYDLMAEPLPQDEFDLVHARMLLIHLPTRLDALQRLAGALRPGGWLAVTDVDFTSVDLAPTSAAWERTWAAFWDATVSVGLDLHYGARLPMDLRALGLTGVEAEYTCTRGCGGSLSAIVISLTLEGVRERMLAFGASDEDIDEARRLLEDPESMFRGPTICAARAQK